MVKSETLHITDMMCRQCEKTIECAVANIEGVRHVKADYETGRLTVTYEDTLCKKEQIERIIEQKGYSVRKKEKSSASVKHIALVMAALLIVYFLGKSGEISIFSSFPEIEEGVGYMALFLIGVLTSVHCIAMCGGLNLSQSLQAEGKGVFAPSIMYNLGRLTSYTITGGLLGGLGSVISVSVQVRAVIGIFASVCMLLMAFNMLNLVPSLRKIRFFCPKFIQRITVRKRNSGSYYLGLLNGFMPCGPLQSMQLLAIASSNVWRGALSMFFFCMGTIPLMLFFGVSVASLKSKWREKIMLVGVTLILVFALQMMQNNAAILGFGTSVRVSEETYEEVKDEVQYVKTVLQPRGYEEITVKKGIPVEWTITVDEENLNGCNNEILIPAYKIDIKLQPGDNIIYFMPEKAGTVSYSCWMGMIKSRINIVE